MHYRVLLIDNNLDFFDDLQALLNNSHECQFTLEVTNQPDSHLSATHKNRRELPYDIYLIDEEFEQAHYHYLEDSSDSPIILLTQPPPQSLSTLITVPTAASNPQQNPMIDNNNHHANINENIEKSIAFSPENNHTVIDYLAKDKLSTELIVRTIRYAIAQSKNRQQLKHLSLYDNLTGIPNRLLFQTELSKTFAHCGRRRQKFSLALINVDRFKNINDSLGYHWGDQCLIEISQRLNRRLGKEHFIAHLGSDEFAVIIKSDNDKTVNAIAKSIGKKISESITLNEKTFKLHSSIGIASFPQDGIQEKQLLSSADNALRFAKQSLGNKVANFKEDRKAFPASWIESEFPYALREQQLFLEYQMQVDTHSKKCTAVEVLCRWIHPEKGLISPDQFIPTIEKTPMIYDLGLWVINEACENIEDIRLNFKNPEIKLSINVSASQLHHTNFITDVKNIIEKNDINPRDIEFELTESALIKDSEKVIYILKSLQKLGISLAIDDFGKGYSSLSYLVDLPINVLKIDRCFVTDFINNKKRKSVIHAIIALSKGLDLKTVAEGVEDARTANYLMSIGCDTLQGYYIGRPRKIHTHLKQKKHKDYKNHSL